MSPIAPQPAAEVFVLSVRELRLEAPYELALDVRDFYEQVLGLPPWPQHRQVPGGLGFGLPRRGLYFRYVHDRPPERLERRFTVVVPSLALLIERLTEREIRFARYRGTMSWDNRLHVQDPVGHLVEIRQSRGL